MTKKLTSRKETDDDNALESVAAIVPPTDNVGYNDDKKEKRERRRSKVFTASLQSPSLALSSPKAIAFNNRRQSVPKVTRTGLSNDQLKDLYSTCIKLSSENKINAKNAFGLHLIDYMHEVLQEQRNEDSTTNFQVASCTLDAGVKIYASRVDIVHSDTFKVLGSLGMASEGQATNDENTANPESVASEERTRERQKRSHKPGSCIETNIKNINCEKFDEAFDLDPYYQKSLVRFDEAGAAGLLLNNFGQRQDDGIIVIDFQSSAGSTALAAASEEHHSGYAKVSDLCHCIEAAVASESKICPFLDDFTFSGWHPDSGAAFIPLLSYSASKKFQMNENAGLDLFGSPTQGCPDYEDDMDFGGGDASNGASPVLTMHLTGNAASLYHSLRPHNQLPVLTSPSMLIVELTTAPSDYAYFKSDLSMWAGPGHWKVNPKDRATRLPSRPQRKSRVPKKEFLIDWDAPLDQAALFSIGKSNTYLPKSSHGPSAFTLPVKLEYNLNNLFKLFTKPLLKLSAPAVPDAQPVVEAALEGNYDFNNENDCENFCAAVGFDDDDDDDDICAGFQGDISPGPAVAKHDGSLTLVPQPATVPFVHIGYAKSAKRIDVKKLKQTIWSMIEANKMPTVSSDEESRPVASPPPLTFSDVCRQLPGQLSSQMAQNLSVPITFVTLLHICNEKGLLLSSSDSLSNFCITKDPNSAALA